jgi:hypothetical protein
MDTYVAESESRSRVTYCSLRVTTFWQRNLASRVTRVLVNSNKSIKKNTTDVVSSNIKQGDVYNIRFVDSPKRNYHVVVLRSKRPFYNQTTTMTM